MKRAPSTPADPDEARATFGARTHPTDTLTEVGERAARQRTGRLNAATFAKAAAGFPVSRLTCTVLRAALEELPTAEATTTTAKAPTADHD